jgi:hypothetical protein
MALFSGLFMCWIFGVGATDVVNEGFIVTNDPPNAPLIRHCTYILVFGNAPNYVRLACVGGCLVYAQMGPHFGDSVPFREYWQYVLARSYIS